MSSLKVTIGDTSIKDGVFLPYEKSTAKPKIRFDQKPDKFYTIAMVDPDALAKYWLHLLIINSKTNIAKYQIPKPPVGGGPHRYIFYLFEQSGQLDEEDVKKSLGNVLKERGNFRFGEFVEKNKLKKVEETYFTTERKEEIKEIQKKE